MALNLESMNELLKSYEKENIIIIFKKTQYRQNAGKNKRNGQFTFNKLEHKMLIQKDGYYLLFVYHNKDFKFGKLLKPKDIKFHKQISWRSLMDGDSN